VALALTGDAGQTDPVCQWAPNHHVVEEAIARANHEARDSLVRVDDAR